MGKGIVARMTTIPFSMPVGNSKRFRPIVRRTTFGSTGCHRRWLGLPVQRPSCRIARRNVSTSRGFRFVRKRIVRSIGTNANCTMSPIDATPQMPTCGRCFHHHRGTQTTPHQSPSNTTCRPLSNTFDWIPTNRRTFAKTDRMPSTNRSNRYRSMR